MGNSDDDSFADRLSESMERLLSWAPSDPTATDPDHEYVAEVPDPHALDMLRDPRIDVHSCEDAAFGLDHGTQDVTFSLECDGDCGVDAEEADGDGAGGAIDPDDRAVHLRVTVDRDGYTETYTDVVRECERAVGLPPGTNVYVEQIDVVGDDREPPDAPDDRCGVGVAETPAADPRDDGYAPDTDFAADADAWDTVDAGTYADADLPSGDDMAGMLLEDVHGVVTSSRDTHGDAVENQSHIAEGWTWYLRGQGLLDDDQRVTGGDVGRMMPLVKMSRTAVGSYDVDHDRDVAGYAAIAAACEVADGNADLADLTGEAASRGGGSE